MMRKKERKRESQGNNREQEEGRMQEKGKEEVRRSDRCERRTFTPAGQRESHEGVNSNKVLSRS